MLKIIRHAQSTANAGIPTNDITAVGLSELGKTQAQQFADDVHTAPDLIIVSDAARTQLTAAPLLEKFPNVPVQTMPVYEFYFISDYRLKGTTPQQRRIMLDDYFAKNYPGYTDGENCESFNHFIERVKAVLGGMDYTKNILMISHGHFINGVRQIIENLPLTVDEFAKLQYVEHCEGVEIEEYKKPE
jgi:broad specificity phosphatase PhoE